MRSEIERRLDDVSHSEILATGGLPTLEPRSPPAAALRDVALHAVAMRPRFDTMIDAHGLQRRSWIWDAITRWVSWFRPSGPERSFRRLLDELRTGVESVEQVRALARGGEIFGLIRWSDDWLAVRRTLIARTEAQLAWFGGAPNIPLELNDHA